MVVSYGQYSVTSSPIKMDTTNQSQYYVSTMVIGIAQYWPVVH